MTTTTLNQTLDVDDALILAAAVARQWLREAPEELPIVAHWLDVDPKQLRQRMAPASGQPGDGRHTCAGCGALLPPQEGAGRRRKWCSEDCRRHDYA